MTTSREPAAAPDHTPYVARSTTDLVVMAPLVLGFHPRDSVVLLTFGAGAGPGFHARVDLPTDLAGQQQVAAVLVPPCVDHDAHHVAVLLHTEDAEAARSQAGLLVEALLAAGVGVLDVVRVEEGRWFPVPEDGDPGTAYDLSTHPFTAHHVFEGRTVRRDRDEVAASLVGSDDTDLAAVTLAATRAADDLLLGTRPVRSVLRPEGRWLQRRLRRSLVDRQSLSAADAGRALALVALADLRDVALAEIERGNARQHVELWRALARRCPETLLPGACGVLAIAAWQAGDGALAWCAVDRAVEVDPDDPMAESVAQLLLGAVSPVTWDPPRGDRLPLFLG
ncbi:DUF4192 domain-containing protein [Nocardioides aurantiacus]|uniref:Uncharacterized protein DUF4192 n=1 Tax=Nocardioides aurantiacus TaxID=86796 RepID=A0A3N2CW11_9ACTN|nr:DUF4192 domain-containing protein [Nocardioides aurantiacus]ROR91394.1 uncharacterized protein DUF4192 [Nocardioides aurantiacus]